jgi:hypothetical protein
MRMGLGAQPRSVLTMVLRETLVVVVTCVGLGGVSALLSTPLISGLLFGVTAHDSMTFAFVSLALTAGAIACFRRARRADRSDDHLGLNNKAEPSLADAARVAGKVVVSLARFATGKCKPFTIPSAGFPLRAFVLSHFARGTRVRSLLGSEVVKSTTTTELSTPTGTNNRKKTRHGGNDR